MDTSETYIKMCEKAGEIQKLRPIKELTIRFSNSPYLFTRRNSYFVAIRPFLGDWLKVIWLPRQDQLQEMVKQGDDKLYPHNLLWRFMRFAMGDAGIKINGWGEAMQWVNSMEQLWLAFVMKEKYNKTWNGEDWI